MKKITILLVLLVSLLGSCKNNRTRSCSSFGCWLNAYEAGQGTRCWHLPNCYSSTLTQLLSEDGSSVTFDEFHKTVEWSDGTVGEIVETSYSDTMMSWDVRTESGMCIIAVYPETLEADVISLDPSVRPGRYLAKLVSERDEAITPTR